MSALFLPLVLSTACTVDERTLVVMAEEEQLDSWIVLEELAREFEAEHPGVHVRLLPLGGAAGAQDKGKFMLAGDLQLDLLRIDITELAAYVGEGALLDLSPCFEADPTWDPQDYFPSVLAALRAPDGRLYGLPSTFTPYVMYVNRDLLHERGLEFPTPDWTWDDFLRAARSATRAADGNGRPATVGISLTQWLQAVAPWIWQNGARLLDDEGRAAMHEPAFVEALEFLHGLLHEERVASFDASFQNQLSQGLFQAGRAAFYGPVGYWETYRFRHIEDFAWDVVPLPRGERSATAIAMTVYVVPRTSAEPELAYRFLRRMAGERYQRTLARIGNGVPGLIAAARSADFLKPDVAPASEHVFLDVIPEARFLPPLSNWRAIETLCQAELEGILLVEDFDVAAACERMRAKTQRFLDREARRRSLPRMAPWAVPGTLALGLGVLVAIGLFRRGRRPVAWRAREERQAYVLLLPWGLGFLLFLVGPALVSLVLACSEWTPLRPFADKRWVALENVTRLFSDATFATSLKATAVYALVAVPLGLALALALALLLRRATFGVGAVRTLAYLPAIVSPVIIGALWRVLLRADDGLVNAGLEAVGLTGPAWLRDPDWVVPAFVLMSLWSVGAQMLVFLGALQAVDPALEEAARIDGAGTWRRFRHVLLPALTPVVLFNLLTGSINAFQIFAQPYVMTGGGPGDASRFLILYLYQTGFRHLDVGYASAIAWVVFALLALLCLVLLRWSRRWVWYAAETPS